MRNVLKSWCSPANLVMLVTVLLAVGVGTFLPFSSFSRKFLNAAAIVAGLALLAYRPEPDRTARWFLLALCAFALYRILHTYVYTGGNLTELTMQRYVDSGKRLLVSAVLCVFYASFAFPLPLKRVVRIGVIAGLACGFAYAGYQIHSGLPRASGELLATFFAYAVTLICIFYLASLQEQGGMRERWAGLLVLLLSLGIVLMSGTRTAFLVLVFMSGAFLLRPGHLSRKQQAGFLLLVVLSLIFGYAIVQGRVMEAMADLQRYSSGRHGGETSIGARFEMWRLGLQTFIAHPLFGAGLLGRLDVANSMIQHGQLDPAVMFYLRSHVHQEYLEEASVRGIVGLFFIVAFYLSARTVPHAGRHNALLWLMMCCAMLGMTDVLFEDRGTTVIMCMLMPLALGIQLAERSEISAS